MIRYAATYRLCGLMAVVLTLGACVAKPVFYPNAKYQATGAGGAQAAVAHCEQLAKSSGASGPSVGAGALGGAAGGAAAGAVVGLAVGSVFGEPSKGAEAGAARGGAGGLIRGAARKKPDEITRRFIERCVSEQGYEVIGWR
ncbi:MAG: hypothetical protein EPN60_07310 [Nevskiaceae bacterium]|nr:MAG: hypothetical protein EPO48_08850 [Nevskiaceae bacterium]TAM28352.1 MAG: hypothetical protein EPN60_07310 [Nevskiaceae bacterium]